MTRVARLGTIVLLGLLGFFTRPVWSQEAATQAMPMRIVVQVNEGDAKKWNSILANIRNIQRDAAPTKVAIAVVAIGPGLDMLLADSLSANEVQDAMAGGVEFIACENTMHARKLSKDDLLDGIGYTRAGYIEIVRRQQQGWTYLRP